MGHVKIYGTDMICYGPPRTGVRMNRLHKGMILGLFFNPQTLSVAVCNRSGNVFLDFYWRGSIKDERDATRTCRMGLETIRMCHG